MKRQPAIDWTQTERGKKEYIIERARAQFLANKSGNDYGIERFDHMKLFHVFMLPDRDHRFGHELRCEVVSCEDLAKCKPGHGPKGY